MSYPKESALCQFACRFETLLKDLFLQLVHSLEVSLSLRSGPSPPNCGREQRTAPQGMRFGKRT